MTPSEQGELGTNPGGTPEDAMGCLSPQSSGPSPQHTVSVEGMGSAGGCRRPRGSPSLRKRPGVSAWGRLCFGWLGVSPSLLFGKQVPAAPCAQAPAAMACVSRRRELLWTLGFAFGVQHGGQWQHLQKCTPASLSKAKSLSSCHVSLKKVGRASQMALLEVSPLPGSRPGEGSFGSVLARRWLHGTSPLGQCRC